MKNPLLTLFRKLLHDIQLPRADVRTLELNEEMLLDLQEFAVREQRPETEVAADLLSQAIRQRRHAEANLQLWLALSKREQEVVALVCLGHDNDEIAKRLSISISTVKTHTRSAVQKFGLQGKAELIRLLSDWDFSSWNT
jgi:DNA-binding CsgD family transcriptional regulator